MPDAYPATPRTTATRFAEAVSYDAATVHAVLDEAFVSHVGFVVEGRPVVLPQLHARIGDRLYLHGSTGARAMRTAVDGGLPVCVTVTLVDGLVLARSGFEHSVQFRSVVAHGTATVVTDPAEKLAALDALVEAVAAGRSAEIRPATRRELAATTVLRLPLAEVSVKVKDGPPEDPAEDVALPVWAGVLPLRTVAGAPIPAPDLSPGIPVPPSVSGWSRENRTGG